MSKGHQGELHPLAKLTEAQVLQARRMQQEGYKTKVIWRRVAPTIRLDSLNKLLRGETWRHLLQ